LLSQTHLLFNCEQAFLHGNPTQPYLLTDKNTCATGEAIRRKLQGCWI